MEEEWRDVPGFPGYRVSELGRVRGKSGGILSGGLSGQGGYPSVVLYRKGLPNGRTRYVHHLVAEAFLGARPFVGAEVAHLSGNNKDNRANNLSWKSHKDNESDKIVHGTIARGQKLGQTKLSEADVSDIRRRIEAGERGCDLASEFGVSRSTVTLIKQRKNWGWLGA